MAEAATPAESTCPICGSERYMRKRLKKLYGHTVCRKCWAGFINRRQAAYIIDALFFYILTLIFAIAAAAVVISLNVPEGIASPLTVVFATLLYLTRDASSGKSLGKLLFGLQTFDRATGQPIGIATSMKRNFPWRSRSSFCSLP